MACQLFFQLSFHYFQWHPAIYGFVAEIGIILYGDGLMHANNATFKTYSYSMCKLI